MVSETYERVGRLAGALRRLGARPGDGVGIFALNSDRSHELLLVVPWAGGVVNAVNIRWSPAEVAYSLIDCQTDLLLPRREVSSRTVSSPTGSPL